MLRECNTRDKQRKLKAKQSPPDPPPKFNDKSEFWQTDESVINYLKSQMGSNGVPLNYVIRDKTAEERYHKAREISPTSFKQDTAHYCELKGPEFEMDTQKVYELLFPLFTGTDAERWYKKAKVTSNGRQMVMELREHYYDNGNETSRTSAARKSLDKLYYNSKRSLTFAKFLTKMEHCLEEINRDPGENITDKAKCRLFLDKCEKSALFGPMRTTLEDYQRFGHIKGYDKLCQHMTSLVNADEERGGKSSARGIAKFDRNDSASAPTSGCKTADGKVFTGTYPKQAWAKLTQEDREAVNAAHPAKKQKTDNGQSYSTSGGGGSNKSLVRKNKKLARKLAKLVKKVDAMQGDKKVDAGSSDDEADTAGAGAKFGGQNGAAQKKKSN